LPKVLLHQPVDELRDEPIDTGRGIGDHPHVEFLLHAGPVQQVEHARHAQRVVQVLMSAGFHLEEYLLDRRHPQLEPFRQIVAI
jgi:hypothetical protein